MEFTDEQRAAIGLTGRNLAVSAGAGSGKTATLVERIFHLIADPDAGCRIDNLLVVTFTRAAAGEMKERLVRRIRGEIQEPGLPTRTRTHLEDQLYLLPGASISTIHSFCLDLISSFPNLAGLAPGFELLAEEEARLMRKDFLQAKIAECLEEEGPTGSCLRRLLDVRDPLSGMDSLVANLTELHNFLDAVVDPEALLEVQRELCDPASPTTRALLADFISDILTRIRESLAPMLALDEASLNPKYREQYEHARALALRLDEMLEGAIAIEALPPLAGELPFPTLSRKRMPDSDSDLECRALRDGLMKKAREWADHLAGFDPRTLAQRLTRSADLSLHLLAGPGLAWNEENFQRHLRMRKLTFNHLERIAYRLLYIVDEHPAIRGWYRERFHHVLVDEFQDVNGIQDAIIRAISAAGTGDDPGNRFLVGDVKQSIYAFRQAEPALFLSLLANSATHGQEDTGTADTRIDLVRNFRSNARLLGEFNRIFETLLRRETAGFDYTDGHAFIPGRPPAADRREPALSIHLFSKDDSKAWAEEQDIGLEATFVASQIRKMGPPWNDIAILVRSTVGTVGPLLDALEAEGVPTYCDARIGFLTAVEVIEFQSLLRAIDNPFNDMALLGTLRGPAFRWPEDDLLTLRLHAPREPFIRALEVAIQDSDHPLSAPSRHVIDCLDRWKEWASRQGMAEFFGRLMDELHLLEGAWVRPGGDQRRLNLEFLIERGRQFDRFSRKGLGEFLRFLQDLIDNGEDIAPPSPVADGAEVVRLMSVHKSKGMQFKVVFLPFLGKRFNDQNLNRPFLFDRRLGLSCKTPDITTEDDSDPLLHTLFRERQRNHHRAEELRLLYVALTRAEEAVCLSGVGRLDGPTISGITPARVLSAAAPLNWIMDFAAGRFPGANWDRDGEIAREGIASLHIHRQADLDSLAAASTANSAAAATGGEPPLAMFREAHERIAAHESSTLAAPLRAKVSVTELKRAYDAARDAETPPYHSPSDAGEGGALQAIVDRETEPGGPVRGLAVHRFLATCDMAAIARGERRLTEERDRLVEESILSPEEAALVSLKGIQWFFNSDLGKRVLSRAAFLERERPFFCRLASGDIAPGRPGEVIVLQGVVDLLLPEEEGWTLIDFKTDRCGEAGERIDHLVSGYSSQVRLYELLVEKTLGVPVRQSWLVFLQGRENRRVNASMDTAEAWKKIVRAGALLED